MAALISFDIDGTLAEGDPPGIITMEMVRKAQALGYWIGSCSDRPISYQQDIWERHRIQVHFTVLKHRLDDVKERFQAEVYYHIGDTHTDEYYARRAGFRFIWAETTALQAWSPHVFC